ncbi:ATP-dependent DNA helicase [Desulfomarina profundi]|uniref:ATP-dependent DNA helicase n=1 Tax=Desulfomarina profundi TaxID=2772557 RepID=UPI001E409521|nr:ATP-dependent DNA helicase [Desulfomarina profundi]
MEFSDEQKAGRDLLKPGLTETLDAIFENDGLLAAHVPGYEPRRGQLEMAKAVQCCLEGMVQESEEPGNNILVVEAETGIGKTLAYLIPAILSGRRIVISTATLNLQDQILEKEIPLVEKIAGREISALCIKGRSNYLCLYRWYQYRSNPQLSLVDNPHIDRIDEWLGATVSGDRAELDWLGEDSNFWRKISTHSDQCLGGGCPEFAHCFISGLRKKAGSVDLLIVNHHLFFSDLALRKGGYGEVLPRYEAVIFDEAHHIENVATTFFGRSFSQYQVFALLADIEKMAKDDLSPQACAEVDQMITGMKERVRVFASLFPVKSGRFYLKDLITDLTEKVWRDEVDLLIRGLEGLSDSISRYGEHGEYWRSLERRGRELVKNVRDVGLHFLENDYVHWYERRDRSVVLSATPVEVAKELNEYLYPLVSSCILTSATLSSGGNFSYLRARLGLGDEVECLQFHSPFDYEKRALLYVPDNSFPEPSAPDYGDVLCGQILDILRISEGRGLVLFTSFKGMERVASFLEDRFDYPVLVQGTASRQSLLTRFREETHSVLLAVASFWEGVDVVGESLSCVIIDKLPFEVPTDPVIEARIQHILEKQGKPFFEFQVPRAILALRQGMGRLMRSSTDRGVIAVMDVRLYKKGYGGLFLRSMPPAPVVRTVQELSDFFKLFD